jgi:hypothetical protein
VRPPVGYGKAGIAFVTGFVRVIAVPVDVAGVVNAQLVHSGKLRIEIEEKISAQLRIWG